MAIENLFLAIPSVGVVGVLNIIRLWCRDRRDTALARHVFDATGDTDALDGYTHLTAARTRRNQPLSREPPMR